MYYEEFTPHISLTPYVRCIWLFESSAVDGVGDVQRIVPDGFPELLLHYGDQFHEVDAEGVVTKQSRLIFAGQISGPLTLQPGAAAGVMGVRFWPAAARALLRLPMIEATDQRLDMRDILGASTSMLVDEVFSAPNPSARVAVMEQFLISRLLKNQSSATANTAKFTHHHAATMYCVQHLYQSGGEMSIDRLAEMANLSSRQLERRFLSEVGISPRLLASIFRFRRVFDFMEQRSPQAVRWTEAALSAGYFDQAHMIRDFKRFAGQRPQAFYRSLHGLSAAMVSINESSPT
jgi:AraC-like DNA-binding protein